MIWSSDHGLGLQTMFLVFYRMVSSLKYGLGLEGLGHEQLGLGLEATGLELYNDLLSMVCDFWRGKFKIYWLKDVRIYILLITLFKNAMQHIFISLCSYFLLLTFGINSLKKSLEKQPVSPNAGTPTHTG